MTQELATTRGGLLTPQDVVANATNQARVLMDIVDKTKCYQVISGKKYLQVEAWETIGAFNRVHATTEWINPIIRDGVVVGYDAKVILINQDDMAVGSAIMPCYFTENICKGKEGDAKDKACKSAAQTFATSKAYRMNYSYVAILAGYEPTPAEEMTEHDSTEPNRKEHYCETHKVNFFKKGNMKGYAHTIGNTKEWCNEIGDKPATAPPAESATSATPDGKAGKVEAPQTGEKLTAQMVTSVINKATKMGYTAEQLKTLLFVKFGGGVQTVQDVPRSEVNKLIEAIEKGEEMK